MRTLLPLVAIAVAVKLLSLVLRASVATADTIHTLAQRAVVDPTDG